MMNAHVGDELVVRPFGTEHSVRDGEIVGIADPDGAPPYTVRWDDGRESLVFPGPDASVRHLHGCGPNDHDHDHQH